MLVYKNTFYGVRNIFGITVNLFISSSYTFISIKTKHFFKFIDPSCWSKSDIKNWMTWTQQQYNIPPFDFGLWATYTGAGFVRLNEDEFKQRIPQVKSNTF